MRRGTLSAPPKAAVVPYRIAGIDVHKKMLAVVVADVEIDQMKARLTNLKE